MVTVGLTGGIGAGKSTVAALLAARGAVVVDADRIARQVLEPGRPAFQAVVERFGPRVVLPDGRLDRAGVAALVFSDPDALATLNEITHPAIAAMIGCRLAEESGTDHVVVVDLPLLTEGMRSAYRFDGVITVDAPSDVALDRLVGQRGFDEADARARMAAQPSRDQRRDLADIVVDNSGSRHDLEKAVARVWDWLLALR